MPRPLIVSSEITPPEVWAGRRQFLSRLGDAAGLAALPTPLLANSAAPTAIAGNPAGDPPLPQPIRRSRDLPDEHITSKETITRYGNFYEFGPDKDSPAKNAHRLRIRPWILQIDGEVKKPRTFDIDDILRWAPLEERVYRLRCVESWSAVVPWVGMPLAELIRRVEITGNARYVEFWSLADPEQMPWVRSPFLDWPYREGLRLDEALHPLTLLAVGMYGQALPRQNGAPVRLVVPWKYGYKSAKSLVRIRFVEQMPITSWMKSAPDEYGFYSNVNPEVAHRRWSQGHERRLGEFWRRKTLPFNGYAEEVAGLYAGMDLKHYF